MILKQWLIVNELFYTYPKSNVSSQTVKALFGPESNSSDRGRSCVPQTGPIEEWPPLDIR